MSTETIAPAPAAPEGFTPSDPGYFDGPSIQVETAHGCIAVAADWTASQGTRIHLSEVYGPLSPLEALRLAAQLKHLAKKTRS